MCIFSDMLSMKILSKPSDCSLYSQSVNLPTNVGENAIFDWCVQNRVQSIGKFVSMVVFIIFFISVCQSLCVCVYVDVACSFFPIHLTFAFICLAFVWPFSFGWMRCILVRPTLWLQFIYYLNSVLPSSAHKICMSFNRSTVPKRCNIQWMPSARNAVCESM